jgi:CheY-like chemotaxis protein
VEASALLSLVQRVCKDPGQYVLVIDQSPEHSSNLKKILDVERFKVQVANTGAAALEMLKSSPPSLIFVDVSRPVMDGFEVLRKLAEHTEWSKIPLVILSAKELTENDRQELVRSIREQLKKRGGAPENLTAMLKRVLTQQSPPTS